MRSVSALIVAVAAVAVSGCVSTQQRSDRDKLRADRTLASRRPLRVTPSTQVAVRGVALVPGAMVVELDNRTGRPLSDVPISVGVGRARLNARGGLDFFQTHVASIPAGGRVTWVFRTPRRVPRGRPFAVVGAAARSPAMLPRLRVTPARGGVVVHNRSDVPQYGLPIYAVARRGTRVVAAARATVADLGGGASIAVALPLALARRGARLQLEALPTIYR